MIAVSFSPGGTKMPECARESRLALGAEWSKRSILAPMRIELASLPKAQKRRARGGSALSHMGHLHHPLQNKLFWRSFATGIVAMRPASR